ncbi:MULTISPECIES: hypothetical protein [Salinibaculum]|uniref:DUF7860 family protein n=1 Tax=Salinibaculum TaxID=2732368 RepID=UPI0030CEEAC0
MAHTSSMDYGKRAKQGFLLGVGLFAFGALGEILVHSVFGGVPGWERALLFDAEVLGILIGLLSPFVFGIALPLME